MSDTPETVAKVADAAPAKREWVLMKRGYFYRPKAAGYTSNICEAGRWTEGEAREHVYPFDEPVTMHHISKFDVPPELRFQSKASGLWYGKIDAAGDIACVEVNGICYFPRH